MRANNGSAAGSVTLRSLVQSIGVGMMTTVDDAGRLNSRPMRALMRDRDSDVWFLTSIVSSKIAHLTADDRVNLSFESRRGEFLSVSGRVSMVTDRKTLDDLWKPTYRAWFPNGHRQIDLVALRVTVQRAEYWQAPAGPFARVTAMVIAFVRGEPVETPRQPIDLTADN